MFKIDDRVVYVPHHAAGDRNHRDCEHGIVCRINDVFVFVRYSRNGILQETPEATDPKQLVKE